MEETVFDEKKPGKVVVLGKEFASDDERRDCFRAELRKRLPELKKAEGFPVGTDDDIIALSDPPYYTACPNPWIADFVKEWKSEKPAKPKNWHYSREPFAADVSEGKNDPIYNAHTYHTKVPHKAIMRYILHYTDPGDIVFDGFCGTGMTGVAAQMCGNRDQVLSLGYQVRPDGTVLREETDPSGRSVWVPFSKLGARRAMLNDLSPAATFISSNYNTPVDVDAFQHRAKKILGDVQAEYGWMYETRHADGRTGTINYAVWSDVFVCPSCGEEVVFWNAAVDRKEGKVLDEFHCQRCNAVLGKSSIQHAWVTHYEDAIRDTVKRAKEVPVLINYSVGKQRFEKKPDSADLALIQKIERADIPYRFPTELIPQGDKTGEPLRVGITHVHQFYTKRNLWVMAALWEAFQDIPMGRLALTSVLVKTASVLHNIGFKHGTINLAGALPNALFVPSNRAERNLFDLIRGKVEDFAKADFGRVLLNQLIATTSLGSKQWGDSCTGQLDYVFLDPPFGSNLMYSELNFLWESWLRVWTRHSGKGLTSTASS
jgi:predicted RNA-binding Zn-ribbon protein involved in translation (DUF1610 family)